MLLVLIFLSSRPGFADRFQGQPQSGPPRLTPKHRPSRGPRVRRALISLSGLRVRRTGSAAGHAPGALYLLLLCVMVMPAGPALSQPAYHEPDSGEVRLRRSEASRAIQEAEKLLHEDALPQALAPAAPALRASPPPAAPPLITIPEHSQQAEAFDKLYRAIPDSSGPSVPSAPRSPRDGPFVLVSFTMPEAQLRGLLRDAAVFDATLVIRGLINDDWKQTIDKIASLAEDASAGISIDPTLFSRFQVSRVPTFVLPLAELQPCSSQGCPPTPHVRATGSVSLTYFLNYVARVGTDAEQAKARAWLHTHKRTSQ